MEGLLKQYIDLRLAIYDDNFNEENGQDLRRKMQKLQQEIWSTASILAKKDPHSISAGLLLNSLNEVIDFSEKQFIAFHNFIPKSIIALLLLISLLSLGAVGYLSGLRGRRHFLFSSLLVIAFSMTLFVILDLEHPRNGFIRAKSPSMIRLKNSIQ